MLNSLRLGATSAAAAATFNQLSRQLPDLHGILPTELFPRRGEVYSANKARLDALTTESKTYESRDTGGKNEKEKSDHILDGFLPLRTFESEERVGAGFGNRRQLEKIACND